MRTGQEEQLIGNLQAFKHFGLAYRLVAGLWIFTYLKLGLISFWVCNCIWLMETRFLLGMLLLLIHLTRNFFPCMEEIWSATREVFSNFSSFIIALVSLYTFLDALSSRLAANAFLSCTILLNGRKAKLSFGTTMSLFSFFSLTGYILSVSKLDMC